MGMAKDSSAEDVDRYLEKVPDDARASLEKLRRAIRAAAPDATEHITYGMPTFKLNGRFLVSYAAWANHCSLYPVSTASLKAIGEDPSKYDVNEKGTLRFPPGEPLTATLVRKLVKARVAEIEV